MRLLLIITFLFSTNAFTADKDDRFIVDEGVKIERGYGLTQMYISYDLENHHTDFQFKNNSCYQSKIKKFSKHIKNFQKEGYEHTSTEIFKNVVPGTEEKVATFIITFVKDFLDADEWMIAEEQSEDSESGQPRARPADFLEHKFIHFECALRSDENIYDSNRSSGKKVPVDVDTKGGKGKEGSSKDK